MYKIMILLNTFSSEISWPIFIKFHVDPTVETGLRVCSNGHPPLTVMPIYGKIMIMKNTFVRTSGLTTNNLRDMRHHIVSFILLSL